MKSYFSLKSGATFFLGSSRSLVYHKDDVEFVYKIGIGGNKYIYAHIYLMPASENSLFLYADWGDYFLHLSSITDKEHFMNIMKRPCPTFVQIWSDEHPDKVAVMSMNAGATMGIGIEVENVNYRQEAPTQIPFMYEVTVAAGKLVDASNKLYSEISKSCPLKLWKDRLKAVWGEETI